MRGSRLVVLLVLPAALVCAAPSWAITRPLGSPRFLALPIHRDPGVAAYPRSAAAAAPLPLWSSTIESLGHSYKYTMVGTNPFEPQATPSSRIGVDLIPVRFIFEYALENSNQEFERKTTTYDASGPLPECGINSSPEQLALESPIFQKHPYTVGGTYVGDVQYTDAFQRENFARQTLGKGALNPRYHIVLSGKGRAALTIYVSYSEGLSLGSEAFGAPVCGGHVGLVNIAYVDGVIQTIIPQLARMREVRSNRLPVFLFSNVLMEEGAGGGCCILGYHSAYEPTPGVVQYYATAEYDSSRIFGEEAADVSVLAHELGEWVDDPNIDNEAPAWGHIGQQSGCQANLEVGDPLSGKTVPVSMPNGVTYHPQELAFFSWFFRQEPSIGANGWYSSNGTFTAGAGPVCK